MRLAGAADEVRPDFDAIERALAVPAGAGFAALPGSARHDAALAEHVARAERAAAAEPDNPLRHLQLAEALRLAERNKDAIVALKRCLALDPDALPAQFLLAALSGEQVPDTMPPELVAAIFDNAAGRFDQMLVGNLKYQGPTAIVKALEPHLPQVGRGLDVLDIGCGTGLCGPLLKPYARRLDGIDLSAKMVEQAKARGCYDRLAVGDFIAMLRNVAPESYDLIVAADVLVYVGALDDTFGGAARALRPGGLFAFSVEKGSGGSFSLSPASRYRHDPEYVARLAASAGFALRHHADAVLRFESGKPVDSQIFVHARR
jgi:predicted TPR repeat methyltransferase